MEGIAFSFDWEIDLITRIQSHMGSFGVTLSTLFSILGEEVVLVAILGAVYWGFNKELGKKVLRCVTFTLTFGAMVKNIVLRRRPYFDHPEVKCLKPVKSEADIYDIKAQGFSFPSMHSANAVSAYVTLGRSAVNKALRAVCMVLPILVGVSRFCIGVHYPTDVIVGWAIGLFMTFFLPRFIQLFRSPRTAELILSLFALIGCFFAKTDDYFSGLGMMIGMFIAFAFEERFVNFSPTSNPIRVLLRVIGGAGLFVALDNLLKLPFSAEFLASETGAEHAVRAFRYGIITFLTMAIYPMVFRYIGSFKKSKS